MCTTGTPKSYGADADLKYIENGDWNKRRDSLHLGGRLTMGPAHMLVTLRRAPFSDAPGGLKYVEYSLLDDWMFSSFAENIPDDDDLMDRHLLFSLKAEHFSKGLHLLKIAGKVPVGPLDDHEIGPALRKALAELPAADLVTTDKDVVPCADSAGDKTIFECMRMREVLEQCSQYGYGLLRQLRNLQFGALDADERDKDDGIAASISGLLGPVDAREAPAEQRAPQAPPALPECRGGSRIRTSCGTIS